MQVLFWPPMGGALEVPEKCPNPRRLGNSVSVCTTGRHQLSPHTNTASENMGLREHPGSKDKAPCGELRGPARCSQRRGPQTPACQPPWERTLPEEASIQPEAEQACPAELEGSPAGPWGSRLPSSAGGQLEQAGCFHRKAQSFSRVPTGPGRGEHIAQPFRPGSE